MDLPLVSFVLLTYNQELYVKQAVEGALKQDYPTLEIIISDDCSSDSTFEIIQSVVSTYSGKHKVTILRNSSNMGLVSHLNKLFANHVNGDYIILAAGDDISLSSRTYDTVSYFKKYETSGLLFPIVKIDSNGKMVGNSYSDETRVFKLSNSYFKSYSFMIDGTALAIRKEVLSVFGLLAPTCPTEDSTLRFRCLLLKGIVYVGKPGIYYRIHSSSMSSFNNIFKLNVVNIAEQYEKDVSIAYKYGYINAAFFKKVLLKIAWYKSNRILAEKIYKKPNDIWARIKIVALNMYYKMRMI